MLSEFSLTLAAMILIFIGLGNIYIPATPVNITQDSVPFAKYTLKVFFLVMFKVFPTVQTEKAFPINLQS